MLVYNIDHRWRWIDHHRPIICAQRQRIQFLSIVNSVLFLLVGCSGKSGCLLLLLIIGDLIDDTPIDRVNKCGMDGLLLLFVLGEVLTSSAVRIGHDYFGDVADVERRVSLNIQVDLGAELRLVLAI